MSRIVAAVSYVAYILKAVVIGSVRVARAAMTPGLDLRPAIVEFPLRCRTDGEIAAMASSITITPGTLVVGTAAATDDAPATLFVHAMFGGTRSEIVDDLRDMESRLLAVTRGEAKS